MAQAELSTRDVFDMACPTCGHDDEIFILIETWALLSGDGTDADVHPHAWDEHHRCQCDHCGHQGRVRDFQLPAARKRANAFEALMATLRPRCERA